ncbi:MAG: hypothetical protein D6736_15650, partial [Nitrospinota bacterium]
QVKGAINSTFSFTKSAVYLSVRCIMDAHIPNNAGFFPPYHHPCSCRNHCQSGAPGRLCRPWVDRFPAGRSDDGCAGPDRTGEGVCSRRGREYRDHDRGV